MNDEKLLKLGAEGRKVMMDLTKLIPDWSKVNLTKKGYNEQYIETLVNVAVYVVERGESKK